MISKQQLETIIFAIMVAIFIGYGYHKFVLSNQLNEIQEDKKRVAQAEITLGELQDINKNKTEIKKKTKDMETELQLLDFAIPQGDNATDFALGLYSDIKKRGLKLINMEPQNIMPKTGYKYQSIGVSLNGKRKDVLEFIKYLETNKRKVRVTEASIRTNSIDELSADIKIDVFFSM